ncbi:MAG: potassium transporter TrkH [bacterium]|nr:potassium transporter TrkH [bacterium]
MKIQKYLTPFSLPVLSFALVILLGAALLRLPISTTGAGVSWLDALFTATSATCVTGLVVVDTGGAYTRFGQSVILALIQLGGLGIMTYASLVFYLWTKRIPLSDRLAVGGSLLHDPSFHLGRFLLRVIVLCLSIEAAGAVLLWLCDPVGFAPFSALFHSVSAFCNAGFGLYADSLTQWRGDWGVNLIFMALITLGGLGFSITIELFRKLKSWLLNRNSKDHRPFQLSWQASIVLRTSLILVLAGAALIWWAENVHIHSDLSWGDSILTALFQSVTCRTAGFNTLDVSHMTNLSLMAMILLMFVGGSPGSCAGGIKTTTFAAMLAYLRAQLQGRHQTVMGRFALNSQDQNKALSLTTFAVAVVLLSVFIMTITDGEQAPHSLAGGSFLDILFETVSAFGTVGLSTGLTSSLSALGKCWIIALMFIGRLGPILFLTIIIEWQSEPRFNWPESQMMIG